MTINYDYKILPVDHLHNVENNKFKKYFITPELKQP